MRKCRVSLLWPFHQNLKLIMFATFASVLDFFQYAFKDIILRASSFDVSVHFFHKSSCAISILLNVLHKFYKMTFCFVNFFVCFTIFIMNFLVTVQLLSWIVRIGMISRQKKILENCDQWCNYGGKHKR